MRGCGVLTEGKWTLRATIDGALYTNASEFQLHGIATMPYSSNHIFIWGTALFHRYRRRFEALCIHATLQIVYKTIDGFYRATLC